VSVFVVDTHVVKPEKQEEYVSLMQKLRKYMKEKPETFKELKSWKIFAQMFGASLGGMSNCGSLTTWQRLRRV